MSEVGVADRSRLLRSRRAEISGIVASRKRKLREFFAVCDNEGPLPQLTTANLDAPATTTAEAQFLEACDISQDRLFDESRLPTRRQLRSETSKLRSPIRKVRPEPPVLDVSRKAPKVRRDGSRTRKSRGTTPSERSDGGSGTRAAEVVRAVTTIEEAPMQRSASKGSQTDLPAESAAVVDEIIEETFEHAEEQPPSQPEDVIPPQELEENRIKTVLESPPNSPGVDPRKVIPISAEDAAELPGPLVDGLGSHDTPHKAKTAHLPPREVQERHLRQADKRREQQDQGGRLSIHLPPRDGGRAADQLSSPGSTVGDHSATTPALHDVSTDTSPDNESSRFDPDRLETKDEDPQTPPELKPTPEEAAEKEEHERILNAQIEISRNEILGSSPNAADAQLLMEEQAASMTTSANCQPETDDSQVSEGVDVMEGQETPYGLDKEADEVVEDLVKDEEMLDGVPTEEEVPPPVDEVSHTETSKTEVADSEGEDQAVDAMDVDTATVQDSFESRDALEQAVDTAPEATEIVTTASKQESDSNKSSVAVSVSTSPSKATSNPATGHPTVERMTTRVSSGAMRHKSVSEILGEIPRPNTTPGIERSPTKRAQNSDLAGNSTPPSRSMTPQSPGSRVRSLIEKAKEKERSKLSTVVFAKQARRFGSGDTALMPSGTHPSQAAKEDYFMPLFLANASTDKRGVQSLDNLLQAAHKTITTSNSFVPINENQTSKVLKRIYNLQSSNKWSLRQPKRSLEPNRPTTQWDVLLQEARWMRTDFREERKWKMAVARNLASACAEWIAASPDDRKLLMVNASPPAKAALSGSEMSKDTEMAVRSSQDITHLTPDLISSGEVDSPMDEFDDEPRLNLLETVAPTAIFALQDDDVVFGLRKSPTTDKLLNELPMYGGPLRVPQSDLPTSDVDPDRRWRRPALPLSKYVEGRMVLKFEGPPRKKSRYQYDDEEDDDDEHVIFGDQGPKRPPLAAEQTNVALFNPENKHIRDRIHAGHQFRPPSDYPMPLQSFFECRTASQWTWAEDDELKGLVREYSYNWSLISSMLTSRSLFSSGAERRTPWECFERWIHLEGLPADMQKTHYFRAYNNRLEAANRTVMAQAAQAPQQPNAAGQVQPPARRRSTTSVRVERRRNQKHLTLVDAMRKLAKKRETSLQKQQHAAGLAAMRKANEVPQPRAPTHTPQDFSRLKHERDEQLKERMAQFQQRQEAQRRAVLQQTRNAAQNPNQPGIINGVPQQRGPAPANGAMAPNGTPGNAGQNLAVPGQNRPRPIPPQMAGKVPVPNGQRGPQMPMNGVPQAQMQGMQGQHQLPMPNPSVDLGLVTRAHRISEQQRQAIQMQQQQMPGLGTQIHNSPPRMNGMMQPGFMPNNMMAPFNPTANGVSPPPAAGLAIPSPGLAGSPRMGHPPQQLPNGMVPQVSNLEAQIRQKFPTATQEQVMRMISDTLAKSVHQRQGMAQSAMNAAAGGNVGMNGMNGNGVQRVPSGVENSPQLYAQMLRQQQERQQAANVANAVNAVNAAASQNQNQGTVQGQLQRTGSAGSG